jgi:uncharacterized iron-regulated protein
VSAAQRRIIDDRRRSTTRGDRVEERLKRVEVALVDQSYTHRSAVESPGAVPAAGGDIRELVAGLCPSRRRKGNGRRSLRATPTAARAVTCRGAFGSGPRTTRVSVPVRSASRWSSLLRSANMPRMAPRKTTHFSRVMGPARAGLACAALFFISGCAAGPWHWKSEYGRTNPLVGRIWDVEAQSYLTEAQLAGRLATARFVLLGEQHNNPDDHGLQARIIRQIVKRGHAPAVVMEMLDTDQSEAVTSCVRTGKCTPERFASAVRWEKSGWPDWHIYAPVLAAALDNRLPLVPGNVPATVLREYTRTGQLEGGEAELHRLGLDVPLSPNVRDAMAEEIKASHCGHAPPGMIEPMIAAQRLRDAHMADSLLLAAPMGRAVLIAGFGHVRNDRAVPTYLADAAHDDAVLSVAFVEVGDDATLPGDYASPFGTDRLPFDYVWFTPRFDNSDPCEEFRKQLEKMEH